MDVFKIDQSMGGLGSGAHVAESASRHHQVTTEVSFDTTSDFNLSFFDSSSTPPTPPPGQQQPGQSASAGSSLVSAAIKEEYDESSPSSAHPENSAGVFDALGSDIFSPPPATPPTPSSAQLDSTPPPDALHIPKTEYDSFNSPHRVPPPRPSLNLFPPPKTGSSNPPPTPPSTPITLKTGEISLQNPYRPHLSGLSLAIKGRVRSGSPSGKTREKGGIEFDDLLMITRVDGFFSLSARNNESRTGRRKKCKWKERAASRHARSDTRL